MFKQACYRFTTSNNAVGTNYLVDLFLLLSHRKLYSTYCYEEINTRNIPLAVIFCSTRPVSHSVFQGRRHCCNPSRMINDATIYLQMPHFYLLCAHSSPKVSILLFNLIKQHFMLYIIYSLTVAFWFSNRKG